MIEENDIPDDWLMDLAMAKDVEAAEVSLRRVPGLVQALLPMHLFLALVRRRWQAGQLTIGDVRGIGWSLHCESAIPTQPGVADWGVVLEVEGEEFDEGWRTKYSLCQSIDEKLSAYKEFDSLLPTWA